MKIIDEKGKLFGKLNLIDLLVVLVLIAALIFLTLRFVKRDSADPATSTSSSKLTYTVMVPGVSSQLYEELQRQLTAADNRDQLMASGEMLDAYIVDLVAAPHVNYMTNSDGIVITSVEQGDNARYDLTFTVEANVSDPTVNTVGTQEIRVGKGHILKTTHIELNSTIITCDWS